MKIHSAKNIAFHLVSFTTFHYITIHFLLINFICSFIHSNIQTLPGGIGDSMGEITSAPVRIAEAVPSLCELP